MNYLKGGLGETEAQGEAREVRRPLTPRSEQRRSSWGSLMVSLQSSPGLCRLASKCIRKDGHADNCWPQ